MVGLSIATLNYQRVYHVLYWLINQEHLVTVSLCLPWFFHDFPWFSPKFSLSKPHGHSICGPGLQISLLGFPSGGEWLAGR
jgi:hypothetical protein